MSAPVSLKEIESQIRQDTLACETLLALLARERDALKEKNLGELEQIIAEKAECLSQLEQSSRQRAAWSQRFSGDSPDEAWDALLNSVNNSNIRAAWQNLKKLFVECRTANEVNGKVIARNQQTFARLMGILRGQAEAPTLYTSSGSSSSGGSSNIVGEA